MFLTDVVYLPHYASLPVWQVLKAVSSLSLYKALVCNQLQPHLYPLGALTNPSNQSWHDYMCEVMSIMAYVWHLKHTAASCLCMLCYFRAVQLLRRSFNRSGHIDAALAHRLSLSRSCSANERLLPSISLLNSSSNSQQVTERRMSSHHSSQRHRRITGEEDLEQLSLLLQQDRASSDEDNRLGLEWQQRSHVLPTIHSRPSSVVGSAVAGKSAAAVGPSSDDSHMDSTAGIAGACSMGSTEHPALPANNAMDTSCSAPAMENAALSCTAASYVEGIQYSSSLRNSEAGRNGLPTMTSHATHAQPSSSNSVTEHHQHNRGLTIPLYTRLRQQSAGASMRGLTISIDGLPNAPQAAEYAGSTFYSPTSDDGLPNGLWLQQTPDREGQLQLQPIMHLEPVDSMTLSEATASALSSPHNLHRLSSAGEAVMGASSLGHANTVDQVLVDVKPRSSNSLEVEVGRSLSEQCNAAEGSNQLPAASGSHQEGLHVVHGFLDSGCVDQSGLSPDSVPISPKSLHRHTHSAVGHWLESTDSLQDLLEDSLSTSPGSMALQYTSSSMDHRATVWYPVSTNTSTAEGALWHQPDVSCEVASEHTNRSTSVMFNHHGSVRRSVTPPVPIGAGAHHVFCDTSTDKVSGGLPVQVVAADEDETGDGSTDFYVGSYTEEHAGLCGYQVSSH